MDRSETEQAVADRQASGDGSSTFVDDYLLYLLARASAQASSQFHAVVKRHGLSVAEWRVLGACRDRPQTIGELSAKSLFQQPTLTKIVDRMAAAGRVIRRADPDDGRRVIVSLTEEGRRLADLLMPLARLHEAQVLSGYAPEEAAALKKTLRTLIDRTN